MTSNITALVVSAMTAAWLTSLIFAACGKTQAAFSTAFLCFALLILSLFV